MPCRSHRFQPWRLGHRSTKKLNDTSDRICEGVCQRNFSIIGSIFCPCMFSLCLSLSHLLKIYTMSLDKLIFESLLGWFLEQGSRKRIGTQTSDSETYLCHLTKLEAKFHTVDQTLHGNLQQLGQSVEDADPFCYCAVIFKDPGSLREGVHSWKHSFGITSRELAVDLQFSKGLGCHENAQVYTQEFTQNFSKLRRPWIFLGICHGTMAYRIRSFGLENQCIDLLYCVHLLVLGGWGRGGGRGDQVASSLNLFNK